MALRRPPTTFSDEISAADLAANSVGASELADNAVDTAAIADNAVLTAKIADSSSTTTGITPAKIAENAVTSAKIATGAVIADGIGAGAVVEAGLGAGAVTAAKMGDVIEVKPHIIPGMLQPAVMGKLLDGSTSHSGAYGTTQADGYKYFWTEIKGSKPIPDPRIGAHFGSQRHTFDSLQELKQETAAHGYVVHSIDGRQHMRVWTATAGAKMLHHNDGRGNGIRGSTASMTWAMEITGYFNTANLLCYQNSSAHMNSCDIQIDGVSKSNNQNYGYRINSPLEGRFVDNDSLVSLVVGTIPLGVHTLRFWSDSTGGNAGDFGGIELNAHGKFTDATCDTNHTTGLGSPASTSKITMDSTAQVVAGMSVTGTGIAAGTTVVSVDSATVLTLSAATTATNANQTFTFGVADLSIPAQNVVSYGKKYSVSAVAQHYDPFNGFTNSSGNAAGLHSTYVDTATSLGLGTATIWGAPWAISGTNNIRPLNGGRVVKWIDSTGAIKTSVTMMPRNAQNYGTAAHDEIATASATNTHQINFSDDAVESSLAEVAASFNLFEFGNGSANGNSSWKDTSILTDGGSAPAWTYSMEDGLTTLTSGAARQWTGGKSIYVDSNNLYLTFIGTGLSLYSENNSLQIQTAQNLPYGTHVYRMNTSGGTSTHYIDGKQLQTGTTNFASGRLGGGSTSDIVIYQPKMPPIPEGACIIADYMLMADNVPQTSAGLEYISKGVRRCSASRDHTYEGPGSSYFSLAQDPANATTGFKCSGASNQYAGIRNIGFGTNFVRQAYGQSARTQLWYVNDTAHSSADAKTGVGAAWGSFCDLDANIELGINTLDTYGVTADANSIIHCATDTVSPTHTSSHYQPFETPFLNELVGGDRNMEQTNLVVTADGKTWDEVTRDTSYIGNICVHTSNDTASTGGGTVQLWDEWRGVNNRKNWMNKDFAIVYDRLICLKDGEYSIHSKTIRTNNTEHCRIYVNGSLVMNAHGGETNHDTPSVTINLFLKTGDQIQHKGAWYQNVNYSHFQITRIK